MSDGKARSFEETLLKPKDRVLSTLEADGSRRWLSPRLAKGTLWQLRRAFAYVLIAVFTLVPYLTIHGKPAVLLDVANRKFHILGVTFLPTDTLLMALLMLSAFLGIFAFTALFGRVFCGWACPQTVWLEFVYRPIERLFTGRSGCGGKPAKPVAVRKKLAMYAVFFVVSIHLAQTLLAYFVGARTLNSWIFGSTPWQHPGPFLLVAIVTAWMMWDFAYWREQMCIIGCPYGRFQSALLDKHSVIVSYDKLRGEPRGKGKRHEGTKARSEELGATVSLKVLPDSVPPSLRASVPSLGDCIDCTMCVQVCPTGIDIRDGLQSECVNCTQCIDACDSVMDKVGKPRGLIGYSSQAVRESQPKKLVRPRVIIYPALLTIVFTLFLVLLLNRPKFDMVVLRSPGTTFEERANDSETVNRLKLRITNRTDDPQTYTYEIADRADAHIEAEHPRITLEPIADSIEDVRVIAPSSAFVKGQLDVTIRVKSGDGISREKKVTLRGPFHY
jgi:cytochrome c oxidase accessory protein FixG